MSVNQRTQLVERLVQRTESGTLNWERSIDEGAYQVSFSQHTVKIRAERMSDFDEDEQQPYEDELVVVSVYNASGELLDEFSHRDLPHSHLMLSKMRVLYRQARNRVLNVDKEIAALLDELSG